VPWDEEPLSKRERERLQRQARRERMRRADEAVARRHARHGESPLRVVGSLVALLVIVGLLVGGYFLATKDDKGDSAAKTGGTRTNGASPSGLEPVHPVSINWVGDITLGSKYGLPPDSGRPMFAAVRDVLRRADLTMGNLEGTLSGGGVSKCPSPATLPTSTTTTPAGPPTCFAFQAPPGNAAALQGAGFDLMNLANNHAFDFGADGQLQTIHALDHYGILHTGRPGAITIVKVRDQKLAVVGFAPYTWSNPFDLVTASALIRKAAGQADLVIVTMHAGAEGADKIHTPKGSEFAFGENRGETIAFAHTVVDAGADLVLGSGPHVIRGIERYHGRLIAYSLGNFAGYHNFGMGGNLSLSGILHVQLGADGHLIGGSWRSVVLTGPGLPSLDRSHRSAQLVNQLSHEDFDGVYHMDPDGRIRG